MKPFFLPVVHRKMCTTHARSMACTLYYHEMEKKRQLWDRGFRRNASLLQTFCTIFHHLLVYVQKVDWSFTETYVRVYDTLLRLTSMTDIYRQFRQSRALEQKSEPLPKKGWPFRNESQLFEEKRRSFSALRARLIEDDHFFAIRFSFSSFNLIWIWLVEQWIYPSGHFRWKFKNTKFKN